MRSTYRWFFALLCILTIPLAAQSNSPFAGVIAIPGTVQAENYDLGGEGIAWHDTSPGNAFGVYRTHDMDVGAITGGGHHIGALEAGEWAEYSVNVATTASYTVTLRWASAYAGSTTFRLRQDGVDVSGTQTVNSTGSWQTFTTKTFNANLTAGAHILRIDFETGFWNPDYLQFTSCTAPTVSNPANKTANDPGITVSWTVTTTGSPTLQWLKNGVAIPGQTSATLTLTNVEQGKDGGQYSVRATNSCGTVTSTAATLRVRCGNPTKPGWIEEDISRALRSQGQLCDWPAEINTGFGNSLSFAGSYNIPVLAAAVAYIKEPVRPGVWDMNSWWTNYLQGELGDRGAVWFYGGKELHSYNYHAYNITSVLAVHYRANAVGNTTIRDLARRWLRATFALQAISAMPQVPLTLHAKGQMDTPTGNYSGPWIGTAGERSSWGFWMDPDRNILLANAIGLATNNAGESNAQSNVRTFVDDWSGVYPFTATEKSQLAAAVNSGTLPPNLVSTYLGANLRTYARYHIVAWPGVKATLMEENINNNTSPTFGVAYFTSPKFASGREAHFLYPWQGLWVPGNTAFKNGICNGTALLNMPLRYMEATHPTCPNHPAETVSINGLPSGAWNYWVTVSQSPTTIQ
ncbi:MAG TPA: carbohydrate-binding protein [Thermoanaerobaculia bacterium]|jgi:hypothetical protein|nr:carbohydrate-binding protein [Thermoanaerobaculia bacterium]